MRLEHAVDEAALEVADGRAVGRQPLAAQAVAELDQHALLVELDLELAEVHVVEPVLEAPGWSVCRARVAKRLAAR